MQLSGGDKTIVIYLDVFFLTNFFMDYIVLFLVNKLCRFAATKLRMLFSATLGAIWSVFEIMVPKQIHWLAIICTYVLISLLMIKICAWKCKLSQLLKGVVTLYGVTCMLAGVMHMIYYNTYAGYLINQVIMKDSDLLVFVMISLGLLYLIYIQIIRLKTYGKKMCRVRIEICRQNIELMGMIDTGNVLMDPFVGKPVCVADKTCFDKVLGEIEDLQDCKYHIIPFSSLGCENGLLEVVTVDNMYIYHKENAIKVEGALIGLAPSRVSTDDEYEMLINARVLNS